MNVPACNVEYFNRTHARIKGNSMRYLNRIIERVRQSLPRIRMKMDRRVGPVLIFESSGKRFGVAFCHRRKDRSVIVSRYTFPLCARCTGLWLGFVLGLLFRVSGLHAPIMFAVALMLPLILDGLTQLVRYRESNNQMRILTGVLFGIAASMIFSDLRF